MVICAVSRNAFGSEVLQIRRKYKTTFKNLRLYPTLRFLKSLNILPPGNELKNIILLGPWI